MTLEVDATCAVRATTSVKEAQIEVSDELVPNPHHLTDESIERIRREDEQSENEDKGAVSLIEARINAEAAIAKAEQLLESLHDSKGAVADSHGISTDIALLGEALQAEDVDRIREQTQRLQARLLSPRGIGLDSIFGDISFDSFFTRPPSARTFQQTSRPAKGPTKGQAQAARTSPRPDEIARTATRLPLGKIFGGGEFTLDPNLCFVLMPLAETFRPIYEDHIRPAVQSQGLRCLRADEIRGTSLITRDIWEMLNRARILVADLTGQNPNVFYEVGLAHALGKDVLLLTQTMTDVPFDMKAMRCIVYTYNPRGMKEMEEALKATVSALIRAA